MSRNLLVAGAAAVIAVAIGVALLLGRGSSPIVGTASPSPSPSQGSVQTPSAKPSQADLGGPLPAQLQARWMGKSRGRLRPLDRRRHVGRVLRERSGPEPVECQYQSGPVGISHFDGTGPPPHLRVCLQRRRHRPVRLVDQLGRAHPDPDRPERRLRHAPGGSRRHLVAGWLQGHPDQLPRGPWARDLRLAVHRPAGQARYTLEPGLWRADIHGPCWLANSSDWPNTFGLTPSTDYATVGPGGQEGGRSILLTTQPAALSPKTACSGAVDNRVAHTVSAEVSSIEHTPGLISSAPTAISVGGHQGQWVDVRLNPTWKTACPGGPGPEADFLASPGSNSPPILGVVGTAMRQRVIVLDLGSGDLLAIDVSTDATAPFNAFVAQAMPVIKSFSFK